MRTVDVAARRIGHGEPCFIAAEVGINHNGSPELAHRLIDAAADAGVDGVKFQNYHTEDFVWDRTLTHEYLSQGQMVRESQYEMFKRYELAEHEWEQLRNHCQDRQVVFFATPTGDPGLQQLVRLGVPLLKNGSDYLGHLPLIRSMSRTGIPTVLSTGMAVLAEIDDAVGAFREAGGRDLFLLHCTSSYPTPPNDVHLRKMATLAARFGVPVGLSDHTSGIAAAIGAVALGACILEKHFTLDTGLPGPDHAFSSDPDELRRLVDAVRTVEMNLGDAAIAPARSEDAGRRDFRLSCVAATSLCVGHSLADGDIVFRRPGTGIAPKDVGNLLGRTLRKAVAEGDLLLTQDLSDGEDDR